MASNNHFTVEIRFTGLAVCPAFMEKATAEPDSKSDQTKKPSTKKTSTKTAQEPMRQAFSLCPLYRLLAELVEECRVEQSKKHACGKK